MSEAIQNSEFSTQNSRPAPRKAGLIQPKTLKALHAEWRKLSPDLAGPEGLTERELRLYWVNARLGAKRGPSVTSFNDLTERNGRYLLRLMREETGNGPAWRSDLIRRIAAELWGKDAERMLANRLRDAHGLQHPESLTPTQAHNLIEALLNQLARKLVADAADDADNPDIVAHKVEELRARFKRKSNSE